MAFVDIYVARSPICHPRGGYRPIYKPDDRLELTEMHTAPWEERMLIDVKTLVKFSLRQVNDWLRCNMITRL